MVTVKLGSKGDSVK
jgi:N-acetylmuramoyl-L-alanine amidase CwlA